MENKLNTAIREISLLNDEKERDAAELIIANKELAYQNEEKEKRAAELALANKELTFQNEEKEKRAAELIIANKELVYQNEEKEKRAAELIIANQELVYQNEEKEKRAAELALANKELIYQNEEKEKRAAELIIANQELVYQNEEKEKRAAELVMANKELESFNYISSHDLQEPLRKIQVFTTRVLADEYEKLSDKGKDYLHRMQEAALRMQTLIADLLTYSRTSTAERKFESTDLNKIVEAVTAEFQEIIDEVHAIIEVQELCVIHVNPFQFHQLFYNLIGNSLKFSNPVIPPYIIIKSSIINYNQATGVNLSPEKEYCHISIADNGIGFDPLYKEHIFEIFKRIHHQEQISGTGIGLTIVKKIVENHNGVISATGELNKGATFNIYIPLT